MVEGWKVGILFKDQPYEFDLCTRQIDLGTAGLVRYFWMDSRPLRQGDSPNYRACVDFWWACMQTERATQCRTNDTTARREVAQITDTLILAELYAHPEVCRSKAAHSVFFDSFTRAPRKQGRRGSGNEACLLELDPTEAHRLRLIAESRDVAAIRDELRTVLASELPSAEYRRKFSQDFSEWMDKGGEALRAAGRERLRRFLRAELVPMIKLKRKRGGDPRGTQFINFMIYNAKIRFCTTYANAWVGLIRRLRMARAVDRNSEHLLRFWHCQHQCLHGEADPFWGQVLSLHPLSALVMTQPEHQVVLGRYLESVASIDSADAFDNSDNPAYWDLVGSILIAAHQYTREHAEADGQRKKLQSQRAIDAAARDDAEFSVAMELDKYAVRVGLKCLSCAGPISYQSHEPHSGADDVAQVVYKCGRCGQTDKVNVTVADFRSNGDE